MKKITNGLKTAGFSLYFLILFVERLCALILSPTQGGEYALCSGDAFNYVAYVVTALSLAAGTALFIRLFIRIGRSIRVGKGYDFDTDAKDWTIASVALLFGGMMHTGFTMAGVQFAAYGFLIGAMIVKCVENCLSGEDKFLSIVSLVYATLFSMSIPVCYLTTAATPLRELFFAAEFLAVFTLVPCFGLLLFRLMTKGVTDFSPYLPAAMCVLSGLTIGLNWTAEINWFVLIFAGLTLLCYLTVGLIAHKRLCGEKKESPEA